MPASSHPLQSLFQSMIHSSFTVWLISDNTSQGGGITEGGRGLAYIADYDATGEVRFRNILERSYSWILDPGPKGWDWNWWGSPFNNYKRSKEIIDLMPSEWMKQLKRWVVFQTCTILYVNESCMY